MKVVELLFRIVMLPGLLFLRLFPVRTTLSLGVGQALSLFMVNLAFYGIVFLVIGGWWSVLGIFFIVLATVIGVSLNR